MMRKELRKVDEYKENMYFEAVQDILTKINDPKTKGSAKVTFLFFLIFLLCQIIFGVTNVYHFFFYGILDTALFC